MQVWVKDNTSLLSADKLGRENETVYPRKHEGDFARDFIDLVARRLGVEGCLSNHMGTQQKRGVLKVLIHEFTGWIWKRNHGYEGGSSKVTKQGQRDKLHIGSIRDVVFPTLNGGHFKVSFIGTVLGGAKSHIPVLRSIQRLFSRRKHRHVSTRDVRCRTTVPPPPLPLPRCLIECEPTNDGARASHLTPCAVIASTVSHAPTLLLVAPLTGSQPLRP